MAMQLSGGVGASRPKQPAKAKAPVSSPKWGGGNIDPFAAQNKVTPAPNVLRPSVFDSKPSGGGGTGGGGGGGGGGGSW